MSTLPMQACNCNKAVLSLASAQQTDASSVATRENIYSSILLHGKDRLLLLLTTS